MWGRFMGKSKTSLNRSTWKFGVKFAFIRHSPFPFFSLDRLQNIICIESSEFVGARMTGNEHHVHTRVRVQKIQ